MKPVHQSSSTSSTTPAASAPEGADRPEVRIQITSNPLYLSGTRELVAGVSRRLGFTEESCSQIALAVDEALANVIRHGYLKAPDKPIWISLYPTKEPGSSGPFGDSCQACSLRIVIEDEARQVDPSVIKSRGLDEIRPGGLGVHIIKSVMDHVEYVKRPAAGMRLTMIKHRSSSSADCAASGSGNGGACCAPANAKDRPHA